MHLRLPLAWLLLLMLPVAASAADAPNQLTPDELSEGWIQLFDGETLFGWEPSTKANWKVEGGVISVSEGEPGLLCTTSQFGDYQFKVDFRSPKTTNSGVFLRTSPKPKDPADDCYELNIADPTVSPFHTGSFVKREKASDVEYSPEWRTFDVTAIGGRFTVKLDGKQVFDYTDPKPRGRGFIGLQLNSGLVEFRNVKLKPLSEKPIFNGKDLTGWHIHPDKPGEFKVDDGAIHVVNGPGGLESDGQWADFTLQFEVFSNGKHLNSGVFFRSIPGDFNNGYECQVQNGYKDDDRNQPLDCGTGGFYRRQNARRVVSNDFEWTPITVVAAGKHMAAWVKGYQVSDWTDPREADDNPRKGLRTKPGTLILQGHDKTTDLSFRRLQIVEMAPRNP